MAVGGSGGKSKHKGCGKCAYPCWDCLNDNPEPEGEHDEVGPITSKTRKIEFIGSE